MMEDMALIFLAGAIFSGGVLWLCAFCASSLEKENCEQEEKNAEGGGNCF